MENRVSNLIENIVRAFVFILLLFEEIKPILIAVIFLIVVDQVTGLWKALKFKKFSWKTFNNLYTKMILYLTVIIATYVFCEFILELEEHYFTKGIASVIGFQELSSSYLNVSDITGKKYIKEYCDKIRSKLP